MNAVLGEKVVTRWGSNALGMPTFHMHQADYPEIEAEGQTPPAACLRLIELLSQAGDFAGEAWRCQPLGLALIEARSFHRRYVDRAETIPSPLDVDRSRPPASLVGTPKTGERSPPLERSRDQLMHGERVLFDEIEGWIAITEGTELQEWRGRHWLPDDTRVRPGDKCCLIRDDGRVGELIVGSSVGV
jgi:hypothetical protein